MKRLDTEKAKKLAPIYILDILKEETDAEHRLLQREIEERLRYRGIDLEYKAMSRNINLLIEEGLVASPGKNKGCYYADREFTDSEIRMLIYSVICNKHLSREESYEMVFKLSSLSSPFFDSAYGRMKTMENWTKAEESDLQENLEIIDQAILKKKRIRYEYLRYGTDKKLHSVMEIEVFPFALFVQNQRFILMAYETEKKEMLYQYVDRMKNVNECSGGGKT